MPENPYEPPTTKTESKSAHDTLNDGNALMKTLSAIGCLGGALLLGILLVVILIMFAMGQYK